MVLGSRLVPEHAWARAYAAGVPENESQWAEHLVDVDEARFLSITFWNNKMWRAADRIATIQRLASRPGVVIGMRAAAPDLPRIRSRGRTGSSRQTAVPSRWCTSRPGKVVVHIALGQ